MPQGTTTIDFGAFPGTTDANVAVTGQASIIGSSLVEAWIFPADTAVHSADEHIMATMMVDVVAGNVIAGNGFTIYAVARDLGGEKLEAPGLGRTMIADATSGLNYTQTPTVVGSVGGKCLNTLWGTFTIAWAWN